MILRRFIFILFGLLLLSIFPLLSFSKDTPAKNNSSLQPQWMKQSAETLKLGIEQKHPATYYLLASKLFREGKKDEAVFWFYAGQLRYRFHLQANPSLNPSGDPALFASLSETIGRPLNEYAFGDIPQLAKTINEVLNWDESHENGFTSKTSHSQAYGEIRAGLVKLRDYILQNQKTIQEQRKSNGLENRSR